MEYSISKSIIQWINSLPSGRAIKLHSSAHQGAGEPDVFACIAGRFAVCETKTESGRLSKLQKHRLQLWEEAGAITIVARSLDDFQRQVGEWNERTGIG